jgi:glyoxylase-like metal-dependent hydrolase (beta-lactamase superfamily II)
MILKQFTLGPIEDNNYLLIDEESKEAVLVDCTEKSEDIELAIKQADAKLKYILLTHGHFDHILGVNDFKKKYDCKVLLHEGDKILVESVKEFARNFGLPDCEVQKVDDFVSDGDMLNFGKTEIKVIHTPGHTQGGVCYLIGDKLFSGDTIFYESVGRTDLPGGNFAQLKSSIENKIFTLDAEITIYPGHGSRTTVAHEKANNRFM